jgi:serine/threonine-protein kinase
VAVNERAHCPVCGGSYPRGYRACPFDGSALVDHDALLGSVLADRYVIEELVGEGGLGRVYLARHARMARRYAIKVPSGKAATDPKVRQRFLQEAEAASQLDHPNVVGVIDFGETPAGLLYLVMELADGDTLAMHLAKIGRFDARGAIDMLRQLAAGLDHAHGRGLIHRDLKPDNIILVAADGRPRIIDFGLALSLERGADGRLTTRGSVLGTPYYMSPEQATGGALDARTDVFSLGVILFEMLAGVLPFDGDPIAVAHQIVRSPIPRLAERAPDVAVDREIEALLGRMLEKKVTDRLESAAAIVTACDEILDAFAAERAAERARRRAQGTLTPPRGAPTLSPPLRRR